LKQRAKIGVFLPPEYSTPTDFVQSSAFKPPHRYPLRPVSPAKEQAALHENH
jgi:hypothetical protein